MDGVIIVDKPKDITSRDVVNEVIKKFNTKKVGHTGTLDPLATGVLIVCVGRATKLVDLITSNDKEYIATVELGTLTDTLDSTGNILKEEQVNISKENIIDALNHFKCKYIQEVPIYSAVKVNGKKLYEYARNGIDVELPKKEVEIKNIELLEYTKENNKTKFKFKCLVSKGTYIRSLIKDISTYLNTIGIMTDLRRTKQGKYSIEQSVKLEDISKNNLISITDILDIKKVDITDNLRKKVYNGASIDDIFSDDEILFVDNNEAIAIYKKEDNIYKCYKMIKGGIL